MADNQPIEPVVPKRLAYPHVAMTGVAANLRMYSGTPVELGAEDTMPENSSGFQPLTPPEGYVVYFDGVGWVTALDIRNATLAQLQTALAADADRKFAEAADTLTKGYTSAEQKSWAQQVAEANTVIGGGTSTLLNVLASARGLDVKVLAQKIVDKATAYDTAYGQLLGTCQATKDKIAGAKTLDDLPPVDSVEVVRFMTQ